jgi:hypothetical protein
VSSAAVPKAVSRYGSTGTEVRTLLLGADGRRGDEIVGTTMDPPRLFSEEAKIPGDPAMAESAWFFQTIEESDTGIITVGLTRSGSLRARALRTGIRVGIAGSYGARAAD